MRLLLLLLPALAFSSFETDSPSEALALRRIAEFWKEEELGLVKRELESFWVDYPDSDHRCKMGEALADLYLQEGAFQAALKLYEELGTESAFLHRLECLYQLKEYKKLEELAETNKENETALSYLTLALYEQALLSPENLVQIAEKAQPHFEALLARSLSSSVAEAFAYLSALAGEPKRAASLYKSLAETSERKEELLFQAALAEARFDKEAAYRTFQTLSSPQAEFNQMILLYEMGKFEELLALHPCVPPEKAGFVSLYHAKAELALGFPEKVAPLLDGIRGEPFLPSLLVLADAAWQLSDLPLLTRAIDLFPEGEEKDRLLLLRAKLAREARDFEQARKDLASLKETVQAELEKGYLLYAEGNFSSAREAALKLTETAEARSAWKLFLAASSRLASKETLFNDLDLAIRKFRTISDEEKLEWNLLSAETAIQLGRYKEARSLLKKLPASGDTKLLFALTLRDGDRDLPHFCKMAEEALAEGATLLDPAAMHLALYNAYLELEELDQAAHHLYQASLFGPVGTSQGAWLADRFREESKQKGDPLLAEKALKLVGPDADPVLRGELLILSGQIEEAISLLEAQAPSEESLAWLGQAHYLLGHTKRARELFEQVLARCPTLRSEAAARSQLLLAKLLPKEEAASKLKSLVLQRSLVHEPLYLEAALEYVDLLAGSDIGKRMNLLKKTKEEFTSSSDLLAQDYLTSRSLLKSQDKIVRCYLEWIDFQIDLCERKLAGDQKIPYKEELEKALERLKKEPIALLTERIQGWRGLEDTF